MNEAHNQPGEDVAFEHDYDGIQEYDNHLPNWWLMTLYGAIVFSLFYWLYYQSYAIGKSQEQIWRSEMAAQAAAELARLGDEVTDESLLLMSQVPARVVSGREVWAQCTQCHLADGSGSIGPNLTDELWLHGGKPTDIFNTVMNGVPAKGMQAWKEVIGPSRVRDVVAYVLAEVKGKKRSGKAPEGQPEVAPGS
jgi:cytochrome c oxidase cbb3-type subunit 3